MIAAFDLDGTLLKKNSSLAFSIFLFQKGYISLSDCIFCLCCYTRHLYFQLSLDSLLHKTCHRLLKDRQIAQIFPFLEDFVDQVLPNILYLPALEKLRTYQMKGVECMLFSNSPRFLVDAIAKKLGIGKVFATDFDINQRGNVIGLSNIMDGGKKAALIKSMLNHTIVAFSDSEKDLPFLEAASLAIAVRPTRRLKKIALTKGWEIL